MTFLSGAVGKMYSKPIFGIHVSLEILFYFQRWMCDPWVTYPVIKGHTEIGYSP